MKKKINLLYPLVFLLCLSFEKAEAFDSQVLLGNRSFSVSDDDAVFQGNKSAYEVQAKMLFNLDFIQNLRGKNIQVGPLFAFQKHSYSKQGVSFVFSDAQFGIGVSYKNIISGSLGGFFDASLIPYSVGSLTGEGEVAFGLVNKVSAKSNFHFSTTALRFGMGPRWIFSDRFSALARYELGFEKSTISRYQLNINQPGQYLSITGSKEIPGLVSSMSSSFITHAVQIGLEYSL